MNSSIENSFQEAKLLWEAGHIEKAISQLIKILRQDSTHIQAWFLLGMALEEPEKKANAFRQVLALDPDHRGAKNQLDRIGEISAKQPADSQETLLTPIVAMIKSGALEQAVHSLKGILKTNPNNEHAWYLLGLALDDPSKKVYTFKQVLQIDPLHKKANLHLKKLTKQHGINIIPKKPILSTSPLKSKFTSSTFYRLSTYLVSRAVTISITIIVGVFFAVMISNKSGQIDQKAERQIISEVRSEFLELLREDPEEYEKIVKQVIVEREEEAGLNLPFIPRHILWTFNALKLDWGGLLWYNISSVNSNVGYSTDVKTLILRHLPNTLLLIGTANLLIFLIGIPLALSISRKHGSFIDRLLAFLAPVSSIPSWVIGILFIFIFAFELKILPFGGMYGSTVKEMMENQFLVIGKHMILPVMAVVLSLIFQLVYTWRTYFLIYARENYVELGRAKGLPSNTLNKKYILRPSLPFIITSFSLTLVSFWQTTTALEVVFNWPGLGKLYIDSLPHFWGATMYPGELAVSLGIVVIFAFILGLTVLVLDLVYAIADPQVRLGKQGATVTTKIKRVKRRVKHVYNKSLQPRLALSPIGDSIDHNTAPNFQQKAAKGFQAFRAFSQQFLSYRSATVGLIIIVSIVIGSVYAFIALPYSEIGDSWYGSTFNSQTNVPRLASPSWLNLFRKDKLLSTIILSSQDDPSIKSIEQRSEESSKISIDFTFDYAYNQIPDEIKINFTPQFKEKRPFVVMTWITPDGREIELKNLSIDSIKKVDITEYIPLGRGNVLKLSDGTLVSEKSSIRNPELYVLFTDLNAENLTPKLGTYTLRIEGITFEEDSNLDAQFVILGQVYGMAGTDYMRRDLFVPLVWGMPFALVIGLLGAILTTVLAMIFAAAGVWFGGWIDSLIQRITEANMILPVMALSVLMYALFNISLWTVLFIIIVLNVFSSPTKSFRAAFLQIRNAPYIEAAQAYGATNTRIIFKYMIPRIIPVLIPQLVSLVPGYVFLEATLGMFNIKSNFPTWGRVIYEALKHGKSYGSRYWVLQPIFLLLLTGFAFAMVGFALDKILNPRLKNL